MAATSPSSPLSNQAATLAAIADALRQAMVFAAVTTTPTRVECAAKDAAEVAHYRLDAGSEGLWISLVTPARYLSQSIEADLVHSGDKLDDLLADELVDAEYAGPALHIEHYRDAERLYTFRARVGTAGGSLPDTTNLVRAILAFEATFRSLGDMSAGGDDE